MSRPLRSLLVVLPGMIVVLAVGMWLGGHPNVLPGFLAGAFVDDNTRIVSEAIDTVHDTYYREIPSDRLAQDAIGGMVAKLDDRFSNYFTPKEYASFQREQRSEFSGIGVLVTSDRRGLRILRVYDGSPAKDAGLKVGDVIVRAAGHDLGGVARDKASSYVTGPSGTDVRITYRRSGRDHDVTITRATVSAPFTESKLMRADGRKVGVVALGQFGPGAHADVYSALQKLRKRGATRYVLDLRGNGGGLVSEAQLVASAFLTEGPIVTTKGRAVPSRTLRATGEPVIPKAPLVVLVDRNTASASEIVTGALQDRHRAKVVGTRTFGKGVFQEVIQMSDGGALDITAGQYFTPSGRNLGGRGVHTGAGIKPDVQASDDPRTAKVDEGLDKAVAVVARER